MEVGLLSVKDNETTLGDGIVGLGFVRPSHEGSSILFEQPWKENSTRLLNLLIRIIFQRFYKNNISTCWKKKS